MRFLSTLLTSVVVTSASIPALTRVALRLRMVDVPNERKVHSQAIPRVGGLAMALGGAIPIGYWLTGEQFVSAYLAAAAVLLVFGIVDDMADLRPHVKLMGQATAAVIVMVAGGIKITNLGMLLPQGTIIPDVVSIPLTIVTIVGVTNAINLADGLDGLAGGISLLSLACIGYLGFLEGDFEIGIMALAICGAVFGFLRYNTYPATIFMGDTGSQLLGFSTITLALALTQGATALSPLLPLIVLGFPVLDTVTVMSYRILQGRSPFSADKNHFHHGLMSIGLHHTESVLVIYIIQSALVLSAYLFRFQSEWSLLGGYLLFSFIVLLFFIFCRKLQLIPHNFLFISKSKDHLRHLRDESGFLRWTFPPMQYALAIAVISMAAFSTGVPAPLAIGSILAALGIVILAVLKRDGLEIGVRTVLYFLIPVVAYHSESSSFYREIFHRAAWFMFPAFGLLNIVVSKLTKRRNGFRSTPMDFLILFIVLGMANLPEMNASDFRVGVVAAETIILYFSCEIILSELRGQLKQMTAITIIALLALGISGRGI